MTRSGIPRVFSADVDGQGWVSHYQPIRDRLARVFVAPFAHHIGQIRDAGAQDEGQPAVSHGNLVGFRDHAGVGDHGASVS